MSLESIRNRGSITTFIKRDMGQITPGSYQVQTKSDQNGGFIVTFRGSNSNNNTNSYQMDNGSGLQTITRQGSNGVNGWVRITDSNNDGRLTKADIDAARQSQTPLEYSFTGTSSQPVGSGDSDENTYTVGNHSQHGTLVQAARYENRGGWSYSPCDDASQQIDYKRYEGGLSPDEQAAVKNTLLTYAEVGMEPEVTPPSPQALPTNTPPAIPASNFTSSAQSQPTEASSTPTTQDSARWNKEALLADIRQRQLKYQNNTQR